MTVDCGCPANPGRTISDPLRHAQWHRLVVEQGGPVGAVSATLLLQARGETRPPETAIESDPEVREQNYQKLRRTAKAVHVSAPRGWGRS